MMKPKLWQLPLIGYIVFLLTGVAIGVEWHRLYLFPFPQLHNWQTSQEAHVPLSKKMVITKYTVKTPLFLDRLYFDSIGDKRLENLFLIQMPRHHSDIITIVSHKPTTIYRFISDDNTNTQFDNWTPTDIPISVQGESTRHTRVVKKDFPASVISLYPGGPVASSPILIKVHDYTESPVPFEVLN